MRRRDLDRLRLTERTRTVGNLPRKLAARLATRVLFLAIELVQELTIALTTIIIPLVS